MTEDIPSTRLEEMRKEVAQLWGRKASTEVSRCSTNPKNKTHKTLKKKKNPQNNPRKITEGESRLCRLCTFGKKKY